ncbi:hypothetical protein KGQ29_04560 [Patescibacteria group bacterium]|nr:hypothetical protein [Patescibacteria group bacterium]
MTTQERKARVIARGEHGNHCHVVTGDVEFDSKGRILVGENSDAVLRHLLEDKWVGAGEEVWTQEHTDIKLKPGVYEYVPQISFDPLTKRIEAVKD